MNITALSAEEIARHQLLAAIKLWQNDDHLSALTLAGAAEEILGKRLRKIGREPSFDQMKNIIVALEVQEGDSEPELERVVGDLLNKTRNALKHYAGDESLRFDLRADCLEMLERAVGNYRALTGIFLEDASYIWSAASGA